MGLLEFPNPIAWIEAAKDDGQRRALVSLSTSIAYSQYVTFLYSAGKALEGRRFVGILSPILVAMAASVYTILRNQDADKVVYTAVPAALSSDAKLLQSIHYEKELRK
jgi:hypothetical protein